MAFEHVAHEIIPLWLLSGVNRVTSSCEGQGQSSWELFFPLKFPSLVLIIRFPLVLL